MIQFLNNSSPKLRSLLRKRLRQDFCFFLRDDQETCSDDSPIKSLFEAKDQRRWQLYNAIELIITMLQNVPVNGNDFIQVNVDLTLTDSGSFVALCQRPTRRSIRSRSRWPIQT